jgi:hypothetical protein
MRRPFSHLLYGVGGSNPATLVTDSVVLLAMEPRHPLTVPYFRDFFCAAHRFL